MSALVAGVIIDIYKFPTFTRYLHTNNFSYEQFPGPTKELYLLKVEVEIERVNFLKSVLTCAEAECRKSKDRPTNRN